jgi:hypothetical protein
MSGWDPGWAAGGDAPQPEQPNGLPGPAADHSPSEPGWQESGLRNPLLGSGGWGSGNQLAGVSECTTAGQD